MTRSFMVCLGLCVASTVALASFAPNKVIVRMEKSLESTEAVGLFGEGVKEVEALVPDLNIYLVTVAQERALATVLADVRKKPGVRYAQLDHKVKLRDVPNDPDFEKQWSLRNDDATDINAQKAWNYTKGSGDYVVAIVDGGLDVKHKDLVENIWVNKGEIPGNEIDDDGNGYIDDINGWNAFDDNGKLSANSHGTHVAGIVGARGDNKLQVTGVNWNVKLMGVQGASGTTSTVLKAYGYVLKQKQLYLMSKGEKGANVVATNSSFGIDFADCKDKDYPSWNDMYDEMGKAGILSAAATPNMNVDVDEVGDVPTGCESDYLISVTNMEKTGEKYSSAGYGVKSVDLGAPGTKVLSTVPGDKTAEFTGTSMATPHVAGAVALLHSVGDKKFRSFAMDQPSAAALFIRREMFKAVDKVEDLKTVTGGRLNVGAAAEELDGR